jgi:hypothetical protein
VRRPGQRDAVSKGGAGSTAGSRDERVGERDPAAVRAPPRRRIEAHEPAWQDEDEAVPPRHDLDVELGGAQVGNGAQPAGAERGRRCAAVRRPAGGRRRAGEGDRGPCSCGCGDCHQEDRSLQPSYISHRRPFREAYAAPLLRVTTCERELAAELSAPGCEHRSGDRRSAQLAPPERPGQRRRFPGRRPRQEWARGDDRR